MTAYAFWFLYWPKKCYGFSLIGSSILNSCMTFATWGSYLALPNDGLCRCWAVAYGCLLPLAFTYHRHLQLSLTYVHLPFSSFSLSSICLSWGWTLLTRAEPWKGIHLITWPTMIIYHLFSVMVVFKWFQWCACAFSCTWCFESYEIGGLLVPSVTRYSVLCTLRIWVCNCISHNCLCSCFGRFLIDFHNHKLVLHRPNEALTLIPSISHIYSCFFLFGVG